MKMDGDGDDQKRRRKNPRVLSCIAEDGLGPKETRDRGARRKALWRE